MPLNRCRTCDPLWLRGGKENEWEHLSSQLHSLWLTKGGMSWFILVFLVFWNVSSLWAGAVYYHNVARWLTLALCRSKSHIWVPRYLLMDCDLTSVCVNTFRHRFRCGQHKGRYIAGVQHITPAQRYSERWRRFSVFYCSLQHDSPRWSVHAVEVDPDSSLWIRKATVWDGPSIRSPIRGERG